MLSDGDRDVSRLSSCGSNSGVDGSLGYSAACSLCCTLGLLAAFATGADTKLWRGVSREITRFAILDSTLLTGAFPELSVTIDACAPATLC